MQFHLTPISGNAKTGPMPVSTSSKDTCPENCSLKGSGCYAESGPLGIHWAAVSSGKRGTPWADFVAAIKKLPKGIIWRHNQAGDLPQNDDGEIDAKMLSELVDANKGKQGFTYTHYDVIHSDENRLAVFNANNAGLTINLSAESYAEADALSNMGCGPVVTIQPEDAAKIEYTPQGRKIVTCPATYRDDVSCYTCKLCQKRDNRAIIGFPVHGVSKKKAGKVFMLKSI